MMVCRKEIYDAYCEWLFGIFEKAEDKIDASGYDDYHKRVYGFISEFLLYVWTQVQGLSVYECKVGMTDEKRETAEIKERLAEYFAGRDIAGAKAYMLACLEKRPDVLMEASDITGELRNVHAGHCGYVNWSSRLTAAAPSTAYRILGR